MVADFSGSILFEPMFNILRQHPDGLSEYDLMKELKKAGYPEFDDGVGLGEKRLFESHFVLFHVLYSLKFSLAEQRRGYLAISCLNIRLHPHYEETNEAVDYADSLSDYYLDWSNLRKTSAKDVKDMLNSFWKKYLVFGKREQALSVLGLKEPVNRNEIKQQYKKLAFAHHPDRGGDTASFQKINAAMETLNSYYSA